MNSRVPLSEYISLPIEDRQSHLDLESPCLELGCNSKESRALLAYFLNTTADRLGFKAMLLHNCNNPMCSNPKHLYWGTASENLLDRHRDNPNLMKKVASRKKELYGENHFKEIASKRFNPNSRKHSSKVEQSVDNG